MAWFDLPAASSPSTSSSRLVSGSTMPGAAAAVSRPGSGAASPGSNARWSRARQPSGTPAVGLGGPLARDQPGHQGGHPGGGLVGEDPDIALRAGQRQRPGRRGRFLTGGRQRQRPQRADLDEATSPVLGDRPPRAAGPAAPVPGLAGGVGWSGGAVKSRARRQIWTVAFRAPAPHRADAPGAAGTRNQAAGRARSAWRPAAHHAPPRQSPTGPPRRLSQWLPAGSPPPAIHRAAIRPS
jgi:hypothetical protein